MEISIEGIEGINTLKVEASYQKGGLNYFNGNNDARGMVAIVRGVELKYERGFRSESFMMFGEKRDFKVFLFEMGRNSKKKVAEVKAKIDSLDGEKIAELYKADDKDAIANIIKEAVK